MRSSKHIGCALALGIFFSASTYAQFGGIGKLAEKVGMGGDKSSAAPSSSSGDIVARYEKSYQLLVQSQIYFAEALGLKDQVEVLNAEAKALGADKIDKDRGEKVKAITAKAADAINDKLKEAPKPDAESKEKYVTGLVTYFLALNEARGLTTALAATDLSAGGLVGKMGNAAMLAYVAKETPSYIGGLAKNGKMLLDYASSNGIKAPEDATKLLGGL